MLNIIKAQDQLKDLSDQQLGGVMQTGTVPGYLVLAEQQRRKKMRSEAVNQGAQPPTTTVAEDIAQPSPMSQGVASLPVQAPSFASGGIVSFAGGGTIKEDMELSDEEVLAMSQADRDAWISRMEAATEDAKARNSINQAPPDSHVFETPSAPSTGIIELPQAQEYVRPPAEVAAEYQRKGDDSSVVIPMSKEKPATEMKAAEVQPSAGVAALPQAPQVPQEASPAGITSVPQAAQAAPAPQDMSLRPEDYMTPEELASHQRAQLYAYGPEGYKGEAVPAQTGPNYTAQPEGKERAPIVIKDDQYPQAGISSLPQVVDRESFKRPAALRGSLGKPPSLDVPQEDVYAELQRTPELLPQISVGAPQPKEVDRESFKRPAPIKGGLGKPPSMVVPQEDAYEELFRSKLLPQQEFTISEPPKGISTLPQVKAQSKPPAKTPVEDDMTKGIAALKKQLHVDEPNYKNDEAKRVSSELKARTQKLEDNNLSMALMQASAAMLSSKSTNFGRMLGEGMSGGLKAYASGQKDIRDLQKDIGKLDADIEAALNDRNMKSYTNAVAEKTALVKLYTDVKEKASDRKSNEGIATLHSGDNRYNTDTRSGDSREHNKTQLEVARIQAAAQRANTSEIKQQRLDLQKEKQAEVARTNLSNLISNRDKLAEKIADRTQFDDEPARAAAIKTLANMDKIIARNMAEIYPDLAEKTFDRSKVERLNEDGSKKQDGPTVKAATGLTAINKTLTELYNEQVQLSKAYRAATGKDKEKDKADIAKRSTTLNKQIADLNAQKSKLK